jgi:hypothetical protein
MTQGLFEPIVTPKELAVGRNNGRRAENAVLLRRCHPLAQRAHFGAAIGVWGQGDIDDDT